MMIKVRVCMIYWDNNLGPYFMGTFSKLNKHSVSKLGFIIFYQYSVAHLEIPKVKTY